MDNPCFVPSEPDLNQGGAAQHHELKRVARDSGTSTPTSANGFDGRISLSDDNSSSGQGNDGLERNVSAPNDALHLERRVGLVSGVALIVGTMIGSGIFVSPSTLLIKTKSPGLFLVIWAACGLLSTLGALAYAELGTLIPKSGGEYIYFKEAFSGTGGEKKDAKEKSKSWKQFWGPVPAFLYAWVSVILLRTSSMAIIALAFAEYTVNPIMTSLNLCSPDDHQYTLTRLTATLCICLITFINCFSVKLATKVQNVFTAAKLLAIAIIICGGIYMICIGNVQYLRQGFKDSTTSFGDIATAFYSGLWAYDGWNNLNYVTEELKNPYVNLPRSIMIGIPLTTACYVMVNVAYLAVLSPTEMMTSEAVAVDWGNRILGPMAFLMPLGVALSTFGAGNGSLFTAGRLCYVASREGHLVDVLSFVHIRRLTPSPALLFNSLIALLMIIPGDIASLIDFFSFTAWIFYGAAMLALLVMRVTRKNAHRPYKVPIIIPIIVLIISVYLVIGPIVDNPKIEYLYATLFILAGFVLYVPFVHYKFVLPGMHGLTTFLQMLLEVAPSKAMEDD